MKVLDESAEYNDYFDEIQGYYQNKEKIEDILPVGKRVKKIREMQGLSIDEFSRVSELKKGVLEQIEEQKIYPDLGTIVKLSKALRIGTSFLLGEESGFSYSVVRKEERKNIKRFVTGTKDRPNYQYQSLSSGIKDRHMESFIVTLTKESESNELSTHDGEEFIVVTEGAVKIVLGNKEEILNEGDSIYYHSTIPHNVKNNSKNMDAVILAVIYTGN